MSVRLLTGDSLVVLPTLAADSIDACVTDPPAGISFMGKTWDHDRGGRRQFVEFMTAIFVEVYRVLKPGAHGLVWALPRMSHWTAWALEDAGFEVRDKVLHLFGGGFPKGKNQLKPAYEDWWLIRKPLSEKNVAANVLKHGTGGINIAATRIDGVTPACSGTGFSTGKFAGRNGIGDPTMRGVQRPESTAGRWPSNVAFSHEPGCREVGRRQVVSRPAFAGPRDSRGGVLNKTDVPRKSPHPGYADTDGLETVIAWECAASCAVRMLDEQVGERPGSHDQRPSVSSNSWFHAQGRYDGQGRNDSGGPSRFFYCSKASRADRGEGNDHPTVKNTELMAWLMTLITPPGGTILDPFAGSGSTLLAADRLGFNAIGIEQDAASVEIARRRLTDDAGLFADMEVS